MADLGHGLTRPGAGFGKGFADAHIAPPPPYRAAPAPTAGRGSSPIIHCSQRFLEWVIGARLREHPRACWVNGLQQRRLDLQFGAAVTARLHLWGTRS